MSASGFYMKSYTPRYAGSGTPASSAASSSPNARCSDAPTRRLVEQITYTDPDGVGQDVEWIKPTCEEPPRPVTLADFGERPCHEDHKRGLLRPRAEYANQPALTPVAVQATRDD